MYVKNITIIKAAADDPTVKNTCSLDCFLISMVCVVNSDGR